MPTQYLIQQEAPQVPPYDAADIAQGLSVQLAHFLFPLLVELDRRLDKRLVRTFLQIVAVMLTFRDRVNGLLLSELGRYLLAPDHAPAGTKRLSNLLHSTKWAAALIRDYLWQRASEQLLHWQQAGQEGLVPWDESSWEKPESRHPEQPLSLVVCRSQGRSPWYLLTADPITTDEQAWGVVFAYMRRWQIELSWKYEKSELAFQSPRVYEGEAREKLLLLPRWLTPSCSAYSMRARNCCGSGCCALTATARAASVATLSYRSPGCVAP